MNIMHTDPRENAPVSTPAIPDEVKLIHQHHIKAHAARETAEALKPAARGQAGEASHKRKK